MSSQQYTRKTVSLTQEQSAVLDGLTGWTETGKTINWTDKTTGEAKSFYKKYAEKPLDGSTLEACNILATLGLGTYDKADSFSGVYRYTINKNTLEKELIKKGSSAGGSKFTPKSYDSDGAKKGHEENVAMHEEDKQMHDERMLLDRALLDAIALLKQEIKGWREDANRRERAELGGQGV